MIHGMATAMDHLHNFPDYLKCGIGCHRQIQETLIENYREQQGFVE